MPSSKIKAAATASASAPAAHPHAHHGAAHDYSRNPMNIYWEMTQACGLACRHCRAEAISTPHPEELNTIESMGLLRQIASFDLLVKLRLALDQLLVDVLEKAVAAEGERVVNRFINRIVRVSAGAVDVGDGVTSCASDAGLRRRVVDVVVVRIVIL